MAIAVEATFENGALKLPEAVPLLNNGDPNGMWSSRRTG